MTKGIGDAPPQRFLETEAGEGTDAASAQARQVEHEGHGGGGHAAQAAHVSKTAWISTSLGDGV